MKKKIVGTIAIIATFSVFANNTDDDSFFFMKELKPVNETFIEMLKLIINTNPTYFDYGNVLEVRAYYEEQRYMYEPYSENTFTTLNNGIILFKVEKLKCIQKYLDSTYHGCMFINTNSKTYLVVFRKTSAELEHWAEYTNKDIDVGSWIKPNTERHISELQTYFTFTRTHDQTTCHLSQCNYNEVATLTDSYYTFYFKLVRNANWATMIKLKDTTAL